MKAGVLKGLLNQIDDDVDVVIEIDGYDVEVEALNFNDYQGCLVLFPADDSYDDDDSPTEEEGTEDEEVVGDLPNVPRMCELPEPTKYKVNDL